MSESTITAYRDGRFTTEPAPHWWQSDFDRLFEGDWPMADSTYGYEHGAHVDAFDLADDRGLIATLWDGDRARFVWIPTLADWLDFLTTRGPAFIGLNVDKPMSQSLATLCEAFIAYARHGQGEHIDRTSGWSSIDRAQDRALRRQHAAARAAVAGAAPLGGMGVEKLGPTRM